MAKFILTISTPEERATIVDTLVRYAATFLEGSSPIDVQPLRSSTRQGRKRRESTCEFELGAERVPEMPDDLARAKLLETALKTKLAADGTRGAEIRVAVESD